MWSAKHDSLSGQSISTTEWRLLFDILDILGMFRDLTIKLQSVTTPTIVYLLPQFLRLCTRYLPNPWREASRYSGRSKVVLMQHI